MGTSPVVDGQNMASGGRVVCAITPCAKRRALDHWFVVGIDDDLEALKAVSELAPAEAKIEIMAVLTPAITAQWQLRHGEVKPAVPGALP